MSISNKNYGFSESLLKAVSAVHEKSLEASNPHIEDYSADELEAMIESYEGFEKVKGELAHKGAKNPAALAAWIGERKYGKKKFEKAAHKGKSLRNESTDAKGTTLTEESVKLKFGKDWEMHKLHGSPAHHEEQAAKHHDAWCGLLDKIKASHNVKAAEEHMCKVVHDYDKAHHAVSTYHKVFGEHPLTRKYYDHRSWESMHRAYAPIKSEYGRDVAESVEQIDELSKDTLKSYGEKAVMKASDHLAKAATHNDLSKKLTGHLSKVNHNIGARHEASAQKHVHGAILAAKKLAREEVEELELTPIDSIAEALKHKKDEEGKCVPNCPACKAMKESFDDIVDALEIDEAAKADLKAHMAHEKKEIKDFSAMQKVLTRLEKMHKSEKGEKGEIGESTVNPGVTASIKQSTNLRQGHPQKVVGVKSAKAKTYGGWSVTEEMFEGAPKGLKTMLSAKDLAAAADKDASKVIPPVGQTASESVDHLEEARRGRPPKSAPAAGEEGHEPDQHIVMQLHKSVSSKKPVTFQDGKSHDVHPDHATKFLKKYVGMKPAQRASLQSHASKSHEHFMDSIKD